MRPASRNGSTPLIGLWCLRKFWVIAAFSGWLRNAMKALAFAGFLLPVGMTMLSTQASTPSFGYRYFRLGFISRARIDEPPQKVDMSISPEARFSRIEPALEL
ncbi:hypothetical protein D3C79_927710 [compost metagenome]